jgi:hypothetical protein
VLCPLNRYLVVEMCEDDSDEKDIKILLPENTNVKHAPFSKVKLLQAHEASALQQGTYLIVPSHAVEEATIGSDRYYLILENHVVGFLDNCK